MYRKYRLLVIVRKLDSGDGYLMAKAAKCQYKLVKITNT